MNLNNTIKPNLLIPGAAKSGTSSLHEYLSQHPDIFMSEKKEPHYFSHDKIFNDKTNYYSLFAEAQDYSYKGESSTGYMVFPNVIERIKAELEDPKFIFVLRNPIDRCYSHYNWVRSFQAEHKSLRSAVRHKMEIEPKTDLKFFGKGYKNYYQSGLYGKWIERYINAFGIENIHILTSEELNNDPVAALNRIFKFLNLEEIKTINEIRSNQTQHLKKSVKIVAYVNSIKRRINNQSPKIAEFLRNMPLLKNLNKNFTRVKPHFIKSSPNYMDAGDRNWLRDLYFDDVQKLTKITRKSFFEWKDFH